MTRALTGADARRLLRTIWADPSPANVSALVGRDSLDVATQLVAGAQAKASTPIVVPTQISGKTTEWEKIVGIGCWLIDAATAADPQEALLHRAAFAWHSHFVTTSEKVFEWDTLWANLTLLHRDAFGSFTKLVKDVALDPAMLLFLDNASNVKDGPQENFARELMELFTLGLTDSTGAPNYKQTDVVELAKAWTGYGVTDPRPRSSVYSSIDAVGGTFTIFGQTGTWSGPATVDLICSGPRLQTVATHVARRLCTHLWGRPPTPTARDRVAAAFLTSGLDLAALFRAALSDDELFTGPPSLRSPMAYMIETQRAVGMRSVDSHPEWASDSMGEFPYAAPDVAGFRPATWNASVAVWSRADWARNQLGWTAIQRGWLASVPTTPTPEAAVDGAAADFHLTLALSRDTIVSWLRSERAAGGWGQQIGLHDLICLSPEMNLS